MIKASISLNGKSAKELTRDHQFLLGVHGSARRLLAVAQRGVEDVDLARHVRASFPSHARRSSRLADAACELKMI